MAKEVWTRAGNVFEALGFTRMEAANLDKKSELFIEIEKFARKMKKQQFSQKKILKILGMNNLEFRRINLGHIDLVTIERLEEICEKVRAYNRMNRKIRCKDTRRA